MRRGIPTERTRFIPLDGCFNFRDLGGYPTQDGRALRWGRVFRSDALHLLSATDVVRLRDELRIGAVIDLRSTSEVRSEGRGPLTEEPIRFHHLPLFDGEQQQRRDERPDDVELAERYFLLAEFAMRPIAHVITTLAETPAPAVFHCAAGKDRTGVVAAIILGLLGVDDDAIVADYALTQENLDAIIERLATADGYRSMLSTLPPQTLHANPDTMRGLLERLRARYGSVAAYAEAAGVAPESMHRLAGRLLTD